MSIFSFSTKAIGTSLVLSFSLGLSMCIPAYAQESDNTGTNNAEVENSDGTAIDATEDEPAEVENSSQNEENSDVEAPENQEDQPSEAVEGESVEEGSDNPQAEMVNEEMYQDLKTYLDNQEWEAADNETFNLLLSLVGSESKQQGYFSLAEWNRFVADQENCPNVQRIDELWRAASNGSLGFSAQKRVLDAISVEVLRIDPALFYKIIGWVSDNGRESLVEWMRNPNQQATADESVIYSKKPDFDNVLRTPGHLPAMMYWEATDGQQRDRRFQLFSKCGL